jgi:hypothetical protein
MSYVFRKVKKYTINLLEVFAFSSYYNYISIIILVLTWFDLFGAATVYINSFIILSWIIGWQYEIHKLTKENELLKTVNSSLSNYKVENIREDLAALMHNIWTEDIFKTDLTLDEQYRANTPYYDLSDDDKQVNLSKADEVLQLISMYKKKDNNV